MEPRAENDVIRINNSISIEDDYLIFRQKKIALSSVTHIRFGWLPMRFEMFRVGDRYLLELKNRQQRLAVNLRSYFGIRKDAQYHDFNYLMNEIWDVTVTRLFHEMQEKIARKEAVRIGKCEVGNAGIVYKDFLITWDDLSFQKNYNRLTVNSKSNSSIWTNLYYTETYNVHVLIEFLDWKFGKMGE